MLRRPLARAKVGGLRRPEKNARQPYGLSALRFFGLGCRLVFPRVGVRAQKAALYGGGRVLRPQPGQHPPPKLGAAIAQRSRPPPFALRA